MTPALETPPSACQRPDVSVGERATQQLVKRILQMRWMGMNDEAEQARAALQRAAARVTLLGQPRDGTRGATADKQLRADRERGRILEF
jgi:hypothetical protein